MTVASVELWGTRIGAVLWDPQRRLGLFEYDPQFAAAGIEVAPLQMPLSSRVYSFPALARDSFHGLPGLLADSLPDRFGHAIIDAWLASQGRTPDSFDPVERLCYTGARGMGALEFVPVLGPSATGSEPIDLSALVELASAVLSDRQDFVARLSVADPAPAVRDILRVGTSAGGARAKAVIAWDATGGEVRSGQVPAPPGFSHWLLKFDGVHGNRDRELEDAQGLGRIEYAYYLMARAAGIDISESRLLHENGRSHFMTRRFDRDAEGRKIHMQSLAAIAHLDFNLEGVHSYEQAMMVTRRLGLDMAAIEQQLRRATFNIVARNQDDHVKNIAFLMDKTGAWLLSPAFDLTYAYNPDGAWTGRHQMTLAGKRDAFTVADFEACARLLSMRRGVAGRILTEVQTAVARWPEFAQTAAVPEATAVAIAATHRSSLR